MLQEAGHECRLVKNELAEGTADEIVAFVAENSGAVLMSYDGDFKKIAPRIPDGQKRRFSKLSRIQLRMPEPNAVQRLKGVLDFIEYEWTVAQSKTDDRMQLVIGKAHLRTNR